MVFGSVRRKADIGQRTAQQEIQVRCPGFRYGDVERTGEYGSRVRKAQIGVDSSLGLTRHPAQGAVLASNFLVQSQRSRTGGRTRGMQRQAVGDPWQVTLEQAGSEFWNSGDRLLYVSRCAGQHTGGCRDDVISWLRMIFMTKILLHIARLRPALSRHCARCLHLAPLPGGQTQNP
jgi:hypothetical protein